MGGEVARGVWVCEGCVTIGVVMFLCLSGKLPFPGENTDEIFNNVMFKELHIHNDPDL